MKENAELAAVERVIRIPRLPARLDNVQLYEAESLDFAAQYGYRLESFEDNDFGWERRGCTG